MACATCGNAHGPDGEHDFIYVDSADVLKRDAITLCPMFNPVRLRCGHTFSQRAIFGWLASNTTCPLCRSAVNVEQILPDTSGLAKSLDELRVRSLAHCYAHDHRAGPTVKLTVMAAMLS